MSLIITALFVAALSLGWGVLVSMLVRRRARNSGQEDVAARVTMAGSRHQRMTSLWFATGLAIAGVGLLAVGAQAAGQIFVVLAIALVVQATVLEFVARRRDDGSGDALNRE